MWADEPTLYEMVFVGALLLSVVSLFDEADVEDPDLPSYFAVAIRRPVCSFFAFFFWVIWGAMSYSLNNCATQFAACFTNFLQTATTTTVTAESFAWALGALGFAAAGVFLVLTVLWSLLIAWTMAHHGYLAKRRERGTV